MGRCSASTRIDLTRRPQALGRLQLIFGLPAHLHVLCSIWAFLIHPKQNHKSGGADAVRLLSSSAPPQSSEVIDCMPKPRTWHDVWELSMNLSLHPYLLFPLLHHLVPFLSSITQLSECWVSDVLAPHHPKHMVSISWSYITHLWSSQDPIQACSTSFPTQHKSLVSLHRVIGNAAKWGYSTW